MESSWEWGNFLISLSSSIYWKIYNHRNKKKNISSWFDRSHAILSDFFFMLLLAKTTTQNIAKITPINREIVFFLEKKWKSSLILCHCSCLRTQKQKQIYVVYVCDFHLFKIWLSGVHWTAVSSSSKIERRGGRNSKKKDIFHSTKRRWEFCSTAEKRSKDVAWIICEIV